MKSVKDVCYVKETNNNVAAAHVTGGTEGFVKTALCIFPESILSRGSFQRMRKSIISYQTTDSAVDHWTDNKLK